MIDCDVKILPLGSEAPGKYQIKRLSLTIRPFKIKALQSSTPIGAWSEPACQFCIDIGYRRQVREPI